MDAKNFFVAAIGRLFYLVLDKIGPDIGRANLEDQIGKCAIYPVKFKTCLAEVCSGDCIFIGFWAGFLLGCI